MHSYVWQAPTWPAWRWDSALLIGRLATTRLSQGRLLGKVAGLGFDLGLEVRAEVLTEETMKTAAIEGESLSRASVRSSVARRLGMPTAGLPPIERRVDGLVEILIDATSRATEPLTAERLKEWQASLFPTGYSGLHRLRVASWRTGPEPMQVVSGRPGKQRIHFEAPPADRVDAEMGRFLEWWQASPGALDGAIRAAVAHIWFVTIHPFEDGNGRIARAITDMALAQDEGVAARFYSMSAEIGAGREAYYEVLERAQRGDGDLTNWLLWFLQCLESSVASSETRLESVFARARFWQRNALIALNERQRKVVNRMVESGPAGFVGGLTTRKYAAMARASRATAQREISDLVEKGVLRKRPAGGRSTSYEIVWEDRE